MQCITNYPSKIESANVNVLKTYQSAFDVLTGYSDHAPGHVVALASVVIGGLREPFALREIEAVRLESGAPAYRFSGATARWVADHGLTAHLSLSHDGGMALAFCILETAPET